MAGIPKVKITFDADFDDLKKGIKGGTDEIEGFAGKVGDFGKKAGMAFAVAGAAAAAYAGKLLIDGVKSAIEDEAAQAKLARTLDNVAGATNAQVAATEAYILKTSLANGVTDDVLRPSLDRLARSTKDVEEAQRLQTLALDISAGSGKSLEAVSNALAKGYEGNTAALGKLGVGISAAELKTMSFQQVTDTLAKTFAGQASEQADTFQGKMARLNVAFSEAKETVGSYVLDAITPMVSGIVDNVIPAIQDFASNIGETLGPEFEKIAAFIKDELIPILFDWWNFLVNEVIPAIMSVVKPVLEGLSDAFNTIKNAIADNSAELQPFYDFLKKVWQFVKDYLAPILGGALKVALQGIGEVIALLITGFSKLVTFINNAFNAIKNFVQYIMANPIVSGIADAIGSVFGGGRASGGMVSGGTPYLVGEKGAELFVPSTSGTIVPNNALQSGSSNVININVSGALDPTRVARQIANILGNEATTNGSFTNLGQSRILTGL